MVNEDKPDAAGRRAETLSALVDGELDGAERQWAVERLMNDPALQARWRRHFAARAALGGGTGPVGEDFGRRVCDAVAAEPAIAARQRPRRPAVTPAWLRPAAGVAVAASVALAAMGSLLTLRDEGVTEDTVVADAGQQAAAEPAPGDIETVAASGSVGADSDAAAQAEVRRRLGVYLSNHNQFAGAGGMPGVMPYSRQVGFNAGQ